MLFLSNKYLDGAGGREFVGRFILFVVGKHITFPVDFKLL